MHARDIKIISSCLFRSHEFRTTAYLDMVHVFSSHDFCSRWVVQSHNSVLHRPKRKAIYLMAIEIVLCGTIPYSNPWWILSTWKRSRLAQSIFARSLPLPPFRLFHMQRWSSKVRRSWWSTSCMSAYLVFPWQSRWHSLCCEPESYGGAVARQVFITDKNWSELPWS